MSRKPLLFSQSNAYFPYEEVLQNRIGFSNTLNIDTYIKESFGLLTDNIMLTWADVQCFSKDHLVDEQFICYKVEGLDHKPLVISKGMIKCKIREEWPLKSRLIQWIIDGSPILSLIVLNLITRILPGKVADILMYISILGLIISFGFYGIKIIKRIIKRLFSKEIKVHGISVLLEKPEDIEIINKELAIKWKELYNNEKIEEIVIFEGSIFFKQTVKEKTIRESIKWKFKQNTIEGQRETIQRTVNFILDQNLFM